MEYSTQLSASEHMFNKMNVKCIIYKCVYERSIAMGELKWHKWKINIVRISNSHNANAYYIYNNNILCEYKIFP